MKLFIIAIFCLTAAFAAPPKVDAENWKIYKEAYDKVYEREEEGIRMGIFTRKIQQIRAHNELFKQGKVTFTLGVNQFADMTQREAQMLMNGFRGTSNRTGSTYLYGLAQKLPSTVDWRTKGLVTGVKNQAQCGSCWAFSTTGSLEGQHMKKTGKLVSLSEQNLVDCSGPEGNSGCEGGLMDQAFKYIKKNKGIDSEQSYPYQAEDEKCRYKKKFDSATVTGHVDIPTGSESALKNAVATIGPISVAIDANHPEFMAYSSGILNIPSCSRTQLDHGVLAVGYGTENGMDYWLVKNSWGNSWGMNGYVKMSRNRENQCGIATQASYPLV